MRSLQKRAVVLGLFLTLSMAAYGSVEKFTVYAKAELVEAAAVAESAPGSLEARWRLARACFDAGEFATNNTERAELANRGISAARKAIEFNDTSAAAHYYLGMNLGQLARTKTLGALRLVDQMVVEFSQALALDKYFDHAGPDRNLGLLYRDAPSIGSVGSRPKARRHLQNAAALEPGYPENLLNLAESYQHWGEIDAARKQFKAAQALLPKAREQFSGPAFEPGWADWEKRIEELRIKLDDASKKLAAPSQR